MCRIMEELKEETTTKVTKQITAKVTKQVTAENSRKIALSLIRANKLPLEEIAIATDLPLSEVKKLAEQK